MFGRYNSKAPWPTRPQIGLRVAKARSCNINESKFFSGEPPPWFIEAGSQKLRGRTADFCDPASSQHYNSGGGGSPEKNFDSFILQLRALATPRPICGRVGQGAFELCLPNIRKCEFLSDPCVFGYIY